ncbi:nucleoid-associated protein [Bradyrhizobium australiense]|uniref:Nucleoid-associated protein n=1 Tax=Bradyrhizobium australiense TaxID=2721161 RepID=A0A7Y4LWU8_9BRAD|nr:nucleoid-associated protein [Bradyrhizobium australiense]NOJ41566.1 nucleoid-associated protein [Bradyrhizobium australiense]
MGLLDQEVLDGITIQRMIFHVVGPANEDFQLMDEIDASGFEQFFLDRIRETNVGNRFSFIGAEAGVCPSLRSVWKDGAKFVQRSKELTELFQNGHKGAPMSSRGAFIVAQLGGLSVAAFALIKFDDQKVLRYQQVTNKDGLVRAKVTEVDNTFIEDRKAMQKSALIILNSDGGDLAVYDRANKRNITEYFKTFLGVKRLWTPSDATERLMKAFSASALAHKQSMPDDVKRNWRRNLHIATQSRESIEPGEDLNVFGAQVFGPFWADEGFRKEVDRALHRNRISGEVIEIERSLIKPPQVRRLRTRENILIVYPQQLDDAGSAVVNVEKGTDGSATITIKTQGIIDDELSDEGIDERAASARGRAAK